MTIEERIKEIKQFLNPELSIQALLQDPKGNEAAFIAMKALSIIQELQQKLEFQQESYIQIAQLQQELADKGKEIDGLKEKFLQNKVEDRLKIQDLKEVIALAFKEYCADDSDGSTLHDILLYGINNGKVNNNLEQLNKGE